MKCRGNGIKCRTKGINYKGYERALDVADERGVKIPGRN